MPFCHPTLKGQKSKGYRYPKEITTLGDHIRVRRLDRGLLQREVAEELGVNVATAIHWERNVSEPPVAYWPRIMDFLGYCPYQRAGTVGDRLRLHRTHQGLTQGELARLLGVDPGSVSRWETGEWRRRGRWVKSIEGFIRDSS